MKMNNSPEWLLKMAEKEDGCFVSAGLDDEIPLHQCNDCEEMIPDHLPVCAKCQQWYDERGLKVTT